MATISQDRLNQIALRRLTNISVAAGPGTDGVLVGHLTFLGLKNPVTGAPITQARFAVVSHDQVRFLDAPLAVLAPMAFYDVPSVSQLEERVHGALEARMAAVREVAAGLKKLRIATALDGDRLAATATIAASSAQFLLVAGPDGVRVAAVKTGSAQPIEIAPTGPPLDLSQHGASIDLELELAQLLPQLVRQAATTSAAAAAPSSPGAAPSSPAGSPSPSSASSPLEVVAIAGPPALAFLLEKFGPQAVTSSEIALDCKDDAGLYRLMATHKEAGVFRVRIFRHADAQRPIWDDAVDFARGPRALDIMATVLGKQVTAPAAAPETNVPAHLAPHAGEVWIMLVLVEREDEEETRYVTTDSDGRPYGAARILKRAVFRSVFTEHSGSWRLCIQIEEVRGSQVLYRQLDGARQPGAESRTMAMAHLIASFVPEASQY